MQTVTRPQRVVSSTDHRQLNPQASARQSFFPLWAVGFALLLFNAAAAGELTSTAARPSAARAGALLLLFTPAGSWISGKTRRASAPETETRKSHAGNPPLDPENPLSRPRSPLSPFSSFLLSRLVPFHPIPFCAPGEISKNFHPPFNAFRRFALTPRQFV